MILIPSGTRVNGNITTVPFSLSRDSRGLLLVLNVSAVTATGSIFVKLQYYDEAAAAWRDLKDYTTTTPVIVGFTTRSTTGTDDLIAYPMPGPAALNANNRRFGIPVPRRLRLNATAGAVGGDDITYSVVMIPIN